MLSGRSITRWIRSRFMGPIWARSQSRRLNQSLRPTRKGAASSPYCARPLCLLRIALNDCYGSGVNCASLRRSSRIASQCWSAFRLKTKWNASGATIKTGTTTGTSHSFPVSGRAPSQAASPVSPIKARIAYQNTKNTSKSAGAP